jgi:hypothetical protein
MQVRSFYSSVHYCLVIPRHAESQSVRYSRPPHVRAPQLGQVLTSTLYRPDETYSDGQVSLSS